LTVNYSGGGSDTQTFTFKVMNDNATLGGSASVFAGHGHHPTDRRGGRVRRRRLALRSARRRATWRWARRSRLRPRSAALGVAYDSEQAATHAVFLARIRPSTPGVAVPPTSAAS